MYVGMSVGFWLSPTIAAITLIRRGRVFHPGGLYFRGRVERLAQDGAAGELAGRLQGAVLVRVSGGTGRVDDKRRDLVGITLRFHALDGDGSDPADTDQDLLLATFRSWTSLAKDMGATNTRDLLANDFSTVASYLDPDVGRTVFRIPATTGGSSEGRNGLERLRHTVTTDGVTLTLQARVDGDWRNLLAIHLEEEGEGDDKKTRFNPWNAGRGVVPAGFDMGIRRIVYIVGQAVR